MFHVDKIKVETKINGNQTNNVIHWKGRNGAWDKRYSGFLNEGNCETGNLALIKLLAAPFQYFISFH